MHACTHARLYWYKDDDTIKTNESNAVCVEVDDTSSWVYAKSHWHPMHLRGGVKLIKTKQQRFQHLHYTQNRYWLKFQNTSWLVFNSFPSFVASTLLLPSIIKKKEKEKHIVNGSKDYSRCTLHNYAWHMHTLQMNFSSLDFFFKLDEPLSYIYICIVYFHSVSTFTI